MTITLRDFYEKRFNEKAVTGDSPEMIWLVDNIIQELDLSRMDRVLDVGCGDGYILERVRDRIAIKGYGIDLCAQAIEVANILTGRYSADLEFCVSDAANIPFSDNTFDKIICSEIAEHVLNDTKFLEEVRRVLRAGGLAYITFPNTKANVVFKPYCDRVDKTEGHLRRYSPSQLDAKARNFALRTVKARFVGHFLTCLLRQLVTYNRLVKEPLKKRYEKKAEPNVRPNYFKGFLSSLYYYIFMSDLRINSDKCLSFYVIFQKLA